MNDSYYINSITTSSINVNGGILDEPNVFPPQNIYKLVAAANPGYDLLAREFKIGLANNPTMHLSKTGEVNSQTQWPSRFEWVITDLNQVASTPSGFVESNGIYKVVIEDSLNPTNDPNWTLVGNDINIWIYFGKNETTPIESLTNLNILLDIDRQQADPLTEADTLNLTIPGQPGTNFNINTVNI